MTSPRLKLFFFLLSPEPVDNKILCKVALNQEDVDHLKDAIEDLYYFEFVLGKSDG